VRKVIFFMMVSLDGYFEGPNHDISWHNATSQEFDDFVHKQNQEFDILLFGRRTYEMMSDFWPTEQGMKVDPETAKYMTDTPKVVFSHQPIKVDWENTRLITDDSSAEVKKLKQQGGKNIAIFGSNDFATSLIPDKLIDEFRIMINPLTIGAGTALFKGISQQINLKLNDSRRFNDGNVLLTYSQL
jgi:dihydrofolate reductase